MTLKVIIPMLNKHLFTKMAAFTMLSVSAFASGEGWMTDFQTAKEKAVAQNKDLLLEFTGSDWCPPCKKLTATVFSKKEFVDAASKNFVLVALDFPRKKEQPAAEKSQNKALQGRYAINAYPTVMLCDATGVPYARTGFKSMGPSEYAKMLEGLQPQKAERDAQFAAANKLQGTAKAAALEASLKSFTAENEIPMSAAFETTLQAILKADPADKSGLASKTLLLAELGAVGPGVDEKAVFAKLDSYIAARGLQGEAKQTMLKSKVDVYYAQKNFPKMLEAVDQIIAIDATTKTGSMLTKVKPRIQKMADAANEAPVSQ